MRDHRLRSCVCNCSPHLEQSAQIACLPLARVQHAAVIPRQRRPLHHESESQSNDNLKHTCSCPLVLSFTEPPPPALSSLAAAPASAGGAGGNENSTKAGTQDAHSCWKEAGKLGMEQPLTCTVTRHARNTHLCCYTSMLLHIYVVTHRHTL